MRITLAVLTLALAALASPSSAEVPDLPFETHCVADEDGAAHCSTTVAETCTVTSVGGTPSSGFACWHTAIGYCSVDALQDPPSIWCENYQPPGDDSASAAMALPVNCSLGPTTPGGDTDCRATYGQCYAHTHMYDMEDALNQYEADCSGCGIHYGAGPLVTTGCYIGPPPIELSSAAAAPPALPCYSGIAGSWCTVGALDCKATVGFQTAGAYQYAGAYCGPELWYPCTIVYADTRGNVESCYFEAASTSSTSLAEPCQSGFAQTWCDFAVGPCEGRLTPWTAWGDRWATLDCAADGERCHAEAHTDDPTHPAGSCAPAASAPAAPCQDLSPPPHAGFDCTIAGQHCSFYIWLDLNPPNPTWDCLP